MKTTIDSAGRIVIPREIRLAAGLESGAPVQVEIRDGVIAIEPLPVEIRVVRRGKLRVATRKSAAPPLFRRDVEAVRDDLRRGR
jgi:AbrB family looped-hinge helix DNA binding protein